ncbi:hypothetical protein CPB84DRAFT_637208 [Gymnopilus junonius]|uniref:Uncharacterized protein n=1 Tax=Gymnopilus junonius TaxID=109634 RepID=A0A9P5NSK6_GYMJU|nr:hypothetical protein CPB84DRAFT_637208 [Gymnopilus junonius]
MSEPMADGIHCDTLPSNLNFPFNLRIHPSSPPTYSSDKCLIDDTNFGSHAQERAIRQYGIAGRVWEAAYMMNLYIHPPLHMEFDPPFIDIDATKAPQRLTIIELGSGTDLPEVCPLLEYNLQSVKSQLECRSLQKSTLVVKPLSWGKPEDASALASEFFEQGPDKRVLNSLAHILCSDLIYFPELLGPLLRSLLHLSSPPFYSPSGDGPQIILISYKLRSLAKEATFWSAFGLWFEFQPILARDKLAASEWQRFGENFDDTSFLFTANRRLESYNWTIPELDEDLLGGMGANGTGTRKSDDTFENLLLMGLE